MISLLALNMTALKKLTASQPQRPASDPQERPASNPQEVFDNFQKFHANFQKDVEALKAELDTIPEFTLPNPKPTEKRLKIQEKFNTLKQNFDTQLESVANSAKNMSFEQLTQLQKQLAEEHSAINQVLQSMQKKSFSTPESMKNSENVNNNFYTLNQTLKEKWKQVELDSMDVEFDSMNDFKDDFASHKDDFASRNKDLASRNEYETLLRGYINRFPKDHRAFTGIDTDSTILPDFLKPRFVVEPAIKQHLKAMANVSPEELNVRTEAMRDAMSAGKAILKPSTNVDTEHLNAQAKAMQETASPTAAKNNLSAERDTYV